MMGRIMQSRTCCASAQLVGPPGGRFEINRPDPISKPFLARYRRLEPVGAPR